METLESSEASTQVLADLEYALLLSSSGKRDATFEARIEAQTEKIRQEMLAKHGLLDVAVDLIREGRDEE